MGVYFKQGYRRSKRDWVCVRKRIAKQRAAILSFQGNFSVFDILAGVVNVYFIFGVETRAETTSAVAGYIWPALPPLEG